jgi:hypothetical protein
MEVRAILRTRFVRRIDSLTEKLAGPASKHDREKECPAFDFWPFYIATSRDFDTRGWPRAQNRPDTMPGCSPSQGDFAHPTRSGAIVSALIC